MVVQAAIHPYHESLLKNKKQYWYTQHTLNQSPGNYIEWKKLIILGLGLGYKMYDTIHTTFL